MKKYLHSTRLFITVVLTGTIFLSIATFAVTPKQYTEVVLRTGSYYGQSIEGIQSIIARIYYPSNVEAYFIDSNLQLTPAQFKSCSKFQKIDDTTFKFQLSCFTKSENVLLIESVIRSLVAQHNKILNEYSKNNQLSKDIMIQMLSKIDQLGISGQFASLKRVDLIAELERVNKSGNQILQTSIFLPVYSGESLNLKKYIYILFAASVFYLLCFLWYKLCIKK